VADVAFLPVALNVTGKAGDRVRWTIAVTDGAGAPVDWSAYAFAAQIRVNPWDASLVTAIAVDSSGKAGGILVLTVPAATTTTMLPTSPPLATKSWVWDLQRTALADATDVRTTHGGSFILTMDVTR
jgi:Na+-transporting NADH:ubiquinone oxidoreductase subunit NqrF